jgi:hypothetical protein
MAYERWQQERDNEIDSDPAPKQAAKPKPKENRRGQTFTAPDYGDAVVYYDRTPFTGLNVCRDI